MASGGVPRPAGGSLQRHITLPRPGLAGALLMAGLAGILTLFWTVSDDSGVTPSNTDRGRTTVTALDEQPPAPRAESVIGDDTGEAIPRPAAGTSDTDQDRAPGDASPPAEEDVAVPDAAATPENSSADPTQAGLAATPTPTPTQQ